MKYLTIVLMAVILNMNALFANSQTSNYSDGFDFMSFVPIIFIFGIMYFLLIRPQQKKLKEHKDMLNKISKGDNIITNGGLIGKVYQTSDNNEVVLEVADGVRVRVIKSMIAQQIKKDKSE